jgi:hypothetical protein
MAWYRGINPRASQGAGHVLDGSLVQLRADRGVPRARAYSLTPGPHGPCGLSAHHYGLRVAVAALAFLQVFRSLLSCFNTESCAWGEGTFLPWVPLSPVLVCLTVRLQGFCLVVITYMAFCVYNTVFRIRVFNYFHLTPNHHSDSTSLLFSALYAWHITSHVGSASSSQPFFLARARAWRASNGYDRPGQLASLLTLACWWGCFLSARPCAGLDVHHTCVWAWCAVQ